MSIPSPRSSSMSRIGGSVSLRLHKVQTRFHRLTIPVRLWVWVGAIGVYAGIVAAKQFTPLHSFGDSPADVHTVLGFILSLLLVFRTNTAYDRWWEARKLWGQLLNESRSLIAEVKFLVHTTPEDRKSFVMLVYSLAYALKDHLRGPVDLQAMPGFEKCSARPRHVPGYFISLLYERIGAWREANRIDGFNALLLNRQIANFSDIVGACERIRNTPLSVSYRGYVRLCLIMYLATLPWGLEEKFGMWTVPATMMTAFFMLGLEMIARDVEEPFGTEADDLPLDELCVNNEINLREILNQSGGAKVALPDQSPAAPVGQRLTGSAAIDAEGTRVQD